MTHLSDKAMLVSLRISQWQARKYDKKATQEVADIHNTTTDAGRYNKALLAKGALESITKAVSAARTTHALMTSPWLDDGNRIRSAMGYFDYAAKMKAHEVDFNRAVAQFVVDYPSYMAGAQHQLKGMFNPADYPVAADISGKFKFEVVVTPLPTASDFRVSLGSEEEARIRADIEARTEAGVRAAMSDVWSRLYNSVEHMRERLAGYHVDPATGKTSGIFRDSLVENLRELVGLLPSLNLTGDSRLEEMRVRLEATLCKDDAETLRTDDDVREATARTARDILADMAGYCGDIGIAA